ncbi:hypothetical protein PSTEL_08030 [Paenibacillus stellifer]|uniref:Helicase ATP-binding domain-containing protein n=1 Tax=Paenibacillus stellifer TaxID=169760 RepID=A0A089LSI1_9BACL|nr:hypothetical protein [Paenibacillus stellifer]AIQ63055.1 hypothetical protein PSTEL_08030 [Paenibacillus stellifer]
MIQRNWLEFVNPELIDLFPLQFVNCDQKLPFIDMGYSHHVHIINNYYSHIEKLAGKAFGLIIIEEAHLFLSDDTKKRIALEQSTSEKVGFLTATPIKSTQHDLQTYINIAKKEQVSRYYRNYCLELLELLYKFFRIRNGNIILDRRVS